MARFHVGQGIDAYIDILQNFEQTIGDDIGRAIFSGAAIVADAIRDNIKGLPKEACTPKEKAGLLDGLGIARMEYKDGYYDVKIGFHGYNSVKTKKYPKGQPNAMIARSVEGGSSWRPRHPFVAPAIRATRAEAEKKMAEEIDKIYQSKTG